jgi:hypothetical protein
VHASDVRLLFFLSAGLLFVQGSKITVDSEFGIYKPPHPTCSCKSYSTFVVSYAFHSADAVGNLITQCPETG